MQKVLTYYSFIIVSLAAVVVFMSVTTYTQLAFAIALFPLLVYFAFKVFPRKNDYEYPKERVIPIQKEKAKLSQKQDVAILDIDKRAFLKLIGGTGLVLFLYSIFVKKAGTPFFGGVPGLENNIDPLEKQLTGYRITELDDSIIAYYGFTNKDGAWFIIREDTDTGSFRYSRGGFDFTSGLANREHLKYGYFKDVF